jgi:hydroxyethylthiazole kinase-like uncharacterized protein yjeF
VIESHNPRMTTHAGIVRIQPGNGAWPLHDARASRLAEQAAASQRQAHELMERAGLSVARLAAAMAPHAQAIQVWAGPGNNGGDGLVAARQLHLAGREVRVSLLGETTHRPTDAQAALDAARSAGVLIEAGLPSDTGIHALHIDALLGLGASRAPTGSLAAGIDAVNAGRGLVLSVDLPSGLNGDTGALLGETAVRADATLALLTLKPGCHTAHGRDQAGAVWLDTLGIDSGPPTAWLSGAQSTAPRPHLGHKGRYGDVVVVGGAPGMLGAAWLAARAALAAGAGRVICSPLAADAVLTDMQHPELMSHAHWWQSTPAVLTEATVACGCGGGAEVTVAMPSLLAHVPRLVLDADALNAISREPALASRLAARSARGLHTVLTPHPLEAARLLALTSAQVQADRLGTAAELARRFAATVVLKGSGSIIAAPGQVSCINGTGNAALATAGTGDVLAGFLAGLWAQEPLIECLQVATRAAASHGAAADAWVAQHRAAPLLASELIRALARRRTG